MYRLKLLKVMRAQGPIRGLRRLSDEERALKDARRGIIGLQKNDCIDVAKFDRYSYLGLRTLNLP